MDTPEDKRRLKYVSDLFFLVIKAASVHFWYCPRLASFLLSVVLDHFKWFRRTALD